MTPPTHCIHNSIIFFQVKYICKTVRKSNVIMGGIQTIVVGDFYQFPPVPNKFIRDDGKYAFESALWNKICPHTFVLHEIQRQEDEQLIQAVRETARGCTSADTVTFIKSLQSDEPREVCLAATRTDVHMINGEKLEGVEGAVKIYNSTEIPGIVRKLRRKVDAPVHLALKVNAPVILTVNISHKLVNGLRGTVIDLGADEVSVFFHDLKETHVLKKHNFILYSPKHGRQILVTSQIPLLLAFALTIHRCQGMT